MKNSKISGVESFHITKTKSLLTNGIMVQVENSSQEAPSNTGPTSPSSSYWTWTFGIATFPYVFWGCPFYLVTRQPPKTSFPLSIITTTREWLKRMFDCGTFPLASIFTFLLLFPTISLNIYVMYVFGDIFNHLFISGTYELSMFQDVLGVIRYLPVIIPLDYVWFRGFRVNSMIILLNSLHGRYGGVGCSTVRIRLVIMLFAILGVQVIRYFCYERYEITDGKPFLQIAQNSLEFSLDLFCTLLLPLYCTFCYAVRFQLYNIKALVYRIISQRILPTVTHLDMMKILYTQAADHIEIINSMFSLYLSVALIIMFVGTIIDAENLWKALLKISLSTSTSGSSQLTALLTIFARVVSNDTSSTGNGGTMENPTGSDNAFTPKDVREINADLACILITYGLMFYTIWQAVGTNDVARETHVWLNDFVAGGGGTDVKTVLQDLGLSLGGQKGKDEFVILVDHRDIGSGYGVGGLVWAQNSRLNDGFTHDEFLKKFRMLKAYMHARMQLEKPALLNITLVGILVPSLSGRLRRYQLLF